MAAVEWAVWVAWVAAVVRSDNCFSASTCQYTARHVASREYEENLAGREGFEPPTV